MKILEYLRPKGFENILGQSHLLEEGAAFRRLIESGDFDSIILIGPPGTGKTTIAELVGEYHSLPFFRLHASTSGASDIKNIIDTTRHYGKEAIVFIDEVHRFNKTQQDLLLKVIDGQHAKLIGASTENPYHNLTMPLRSRSFIFNLEKLGNESFSAMVEQAVPYFKEKYKVEQVVFDEADMKTCMEFALGDGRRFLNMLELSAVNGKFEGETLNLNLGNVQEYIAGRSYSTDEHYDLLSAMIKSIRGSDPDAALVWGFKLLHSGVTPETIFRRLLISASEDIGNAYPDALVFATNAYTAFQSVGRPEGDIILSQVLTYLASCPKSNRSYMAGKEVGGYLAKSNPLVPEHLMQNGKGYKYPFDTGSFVKQDYMREPKQFYKPGDEGFEGKIKDRLKRLWGEAKDY